MSDPFSANEFRGALALLADAAPEADVTDLVAAQSAWAVAHRPVWPVRVLAAACRSLRDRPWVAWPVLAAAAAAVLMLAVSLAPSVRLSAPQPAQAPSGPGALPQRVWAPGAWTPLVTEQPVARAAYLLTAGDRQRHGADGGDAGTVRTYVVSADDGGVYRRLPGRPDGAVLSPDGRRVAWWEKPVGPGDQGVPAESTVVVLDLGTGTVRTVAVRSRWGVDTSVGGVVFDPAGTRLAVWGSDSWDGSSGRGAVHVVDAGPVGTARPLRITRLCPCGGEPLAWFGDGRLGYDGKDFPVPSGAGVTTQLLPRAVTPDPGGLAVGRPVLMPPDGSVRFGVRPEGEQADGLTSRRYTAFAWTPDGGTAWRVDLGVASQVSGLDAVASGVVTVRWDLDPGSGLAAGIRPRVDLVTRAGSTPLTRTDDDLMVTGVATDVVEGGRTVPGVRPDVTRPPADRLAELALGGLRLLGGTAAVLGSLWLLGASLAGRGPVRLLRRLRPTRHGIRLAAVVLSATTGVAWLAAPHVVEARWAASAPRPEADAPSLVPHTLTDQRVRPPRAFDQVGTPRTTRLTAAFVGTVAGRRGVYGLDAGTARTVRLDDLPGLEQAWPTTDDSSSTAVALSPSGSLLAMWMDSSTDRRVAVVDLRSARVTLRSDVVHDDGGSASDPWSPLGVADDGSLWSATALERGGAGSLVRYAPGRPAESVGVPGAYALAVQGGGGVVVKRTVTNSLRQSQIVLWAASGVRASRTTFDPNEPAAQLSPTALLGTAPGGGLVRAGTDPEPGGVPLERSAEAGEPSAVESVGAVQGSATGDLAAVGGDGLGWTLLRGDGGVLRGEAWMNGTLRREGRIVVSSGALADIGGQIGFGGHDEPWWTALGERSKQPAGWVFVALAGLLLLPAAGRRLQAWRTMAAGGSTRNRP